MADDIPLASLGQPQPTLADLLASKLQGAVNWWQNQPSWLQQAQAIHEASNPNSLRPTDAEIDFASGMVGPGSTKNVAAKVAPAIAEGASVPLASPTIRAFHGSPHDFDAFDMSKIGTGEGAQAYGHGLYFAENPEVARQYKENLGVTPRVNSFNWNPDGTPNRAGQVASELDAKISDADIRAGLRIKEPSASDDQLNGWIAEGKKLYAEAQKSGKTYEVNINADPEHFLDWDKPLSEQSPAAQTKFAEAIGQPNLARHIELSKQLEDIASRPAAEHALHPEWTQQWDELNAERNSLGVDPRIMNQTGAQLYESSKLVPGEFRDKEIATQKLREAGIPGIKYLDQGSRPANIKPLQDAFAQNEAMLAQNEKTLEGMKKNAAKVTGFSPEQISNEISQQEQFIAGLRAKSQDLHAQISRPTSNYVVFDDKLIDILKKYGLAGLLGSGAMGLGTQQQPQQ